MDLFIISFQMNVKCKQERSPLTVLPEPQHREGQAVVGRQVGCEVRGYLLSKNKVEMSIALSRDAFLTHKCIWL